MSATQANGSSRNFARRLNAVSPSRYGMLKAWKGGRTCPLQLLWHCKAPLAPYPAAKLGDVVHRMMDRLPQGAGQEDAKRAWEEALAHTESKLGQDWVNRGLLPLPRTVRAYTLKKTRAIRSVLRSSPASHPIGTGGGQRSSFREEPLQSGDGLLKGQPDLIERRHGEWVLLDYKSGSVHEEDEDSGQQQIKDEYSLQLRLYAHLIKETMGIVVTKALLRTLDGREHEVNVDAASVSLTAAEALSLREDFNNELQRHDDPLEMAKPMAACWEKGVFGCAGCLFRPLCPAYLAYEKQWQAGERWPKDAWGKVTSIERVGETVRIQIQNENRLVGPNGETPDPIVTVNLRDSTNRHPELSDVKVGGNIQVFDFVAPRLGTVVEDGPRTCVYAGAALRDGGGV
jgi:hypothetical protein